MHHLNVKEKGIKWPVVSSFFPFLCFPCNQALQVVRSLQSQSTGSWVNLQGKWTGNSTKARYSSTHKWYETVPQSIRSQSPTPAPKRETHSMNQDKAVLPNLALPVLKADPDVNASIGSGVDSSAGSQTQRLGGCGSMGGTIPNQNKLFEPSRRLPSWLRREVP